MRRHPIVRLLLAAFLAPTVVSTEAPHARSAAEETVDARLWVVPGVIVESPARIGAHVNLRIDNFIEDGSMEGVHARMHGIAAAVGSIGSRTVITADNLDFYETLGDGFYAGGEIRIYRPTSGAASLVRSDRVLTYSATSGALVLSSTTGAAITAGDVFFLHRQEADPATLKAVQHARVQSLGEPQGYWRSDQAALSRDATTSAPENGGASSLKIVLGSGTYAETQSGGVFHFPGNGWYPALEPGQRYTIELWMKQSGIAGQVDVGLTSDYAAVGTAFTVTGAWQKFRYAFTAPAYMSAASAVSVLSIIFTDPGTLWVDNVALYGSSAGPNGIDAQMAAAFAQYRPGATRNFAAWEGGGTSVADWTSVEGLSANQWDVNYGATPAKRAQLPTLLNLAKDSGGTPWLVVSQAFSETEWLQLFEYLGGPAGTPYGDKRIAQRGVATPWTDEFSVIDIEYGNESWNPFFALNFDSSTYGSLAERFFAVAKTSPYYDSQKFRFVANGWVIQTDEDGYGQTARKRAASADIVDVTAYIGGWESESTYTQTTDEDWAGLLTFGPSDHFVLADAHAATRDALRAQGYTYTIGVYEGGPGYSLPCASCETSQAQEQLGKSLAAGVATLDMYLYMTQLGFGPMNYFEFKTGDYWASHAEPEYGFHAYPTWQALALRNQLANGDMVGAHWLHAPTRDLTPIVEPTAPTVDDAPLLGAYAFSNARILSPRIAPSGESTAASTSDYTVFVLSRSLTQTLRVELELPFSAAVTATLHALTGDPRAHNRYSNTVQVSRTNVAGFGDGYTFDMPPGSIYAFHAESVTPLAAGAGPQAKIVLAPGQAASTNERSMRFEALFSEPVDGFDVSDLTNAGTAADVQWTIAEVPGSNRMRFRVSVAQVNGAGTVAPSIAAGRVQDADGNANSASNSDASVDYTPQRAGLLVREPFDGPARSLRGASGGVGWSSAWQVQDDDDGFLIAETTPLSTATYSTSPGYARAANSWLSAGRALDLDAAGPWADYVDADGALGQSGTTIYAAATTRRDAAGSSAVVLHHNNVPWWVNESAVPHVQFGYFGSNVWGLRSNDCTPTCSQRTASSSAAAPLGTASLLVVRIDFGATDRVRLYVDPPTSGEPALAAAELLLSGTLQIDAAALFGDGSDLPLAIDELRIGGTYESVVLAATPTSAPTHTATPSPTRTPMTTSAPTTTATPTQTPKSTASVTPTPTPTQTAHQVFVAFTVR